MNSGKRNRLTALILAGVMSIALCACGGEGSSSAQPEAAQSAAEAGAAVSETEAADESAAVSETEAAADAGAAGSDAQSEETEAGTKVFVDSVGREVEVPVSIDKVAVSGPLAQMYVFALCPDKLCGIARAFSEEALS